MCGSETPVSHISLLLPPAPSPGAGQGTEWGWVLPSPESTRGWCSLPESRRKPHFLEPEAACAGRGAAEMGNRDHPSSSKGQLVSPSLHLPLQSGQSLVLVLSLDEDGNSRAVMGQRKLEN